MPAILEIENLEVNFRGFRAVDGFDMAVEEGELRVLIGANGAGKTTLMDLITGRTKSTGGKVSFAGDNITNWQEHKIARRGIGRKFQVPSVFKDLTVRENFEVAHTRSLSVWRNLSASAKPRQRNLQIERAMELTSLTDESATIAGSLSHGQSQWLELGMVLVQSPRLVLLDEPTAGMTALETEKNLRDHQRPQERTLHHRRRARHDVRAVHLRGHYRHALGKEAGGRDGRTN